MPQYFEQISLFPRPETKLSHTFKHRTDFTSIEALLERERECTYVTTCHKLRCAVICMWSESTWVNLCSSPFFWNSQPLYVDILSELRVRCWAHWSINVHLFQYFLVIRQYIYISSPGFLKVLDKLQNSCRRQICKFAILNRLLQ